MATINVASPYGATQVNAAIASATTGDTVSVPACTVNWSGVACSKAIRIQGAGIGVSNITLTGNNTFTKSSAGVMRIDGFTFGVTGGGNSNKPLITTGTWAADPIIITNCRHNVSGSGLYHVPVVGGVIWSDCSFYGAWDDSFITPKLPGDTASWQSDDTIGARDTTGKKNHYVEDCFFYGGTNQGIDADDGSRVVFRYNVCHFMSFNSHGLDTSETGVRHWEVYNNEFRNNSSITGWNSTIGNQNWAIWIRGATGVIFNNVIDDIANSYWGLSKSEGKFDIRAVQDGSGASYGYFTDGRAKYSAGYGTYPRQHQLAHNWSDSLSNSVGLKGGVGDLFIDPICIWGNTGAGAAANGGLKGFQNGGSWGDQTGYFNSGRDYYNDGTQRSGYSYYTYPHPLISGSQSPPTGTITLSVR